MTLNPDYDPQTKPNVGPAAPDGPPPVEPEAPAHDPVEPEEPEAPQEPEPEPAPVGSQRENAESSLDQPSDDSD